MSRAKSKQIKDLWKKPKEERYAAVAFRSPLHAEAFGFMMAMHNAIRLLEIEAKLPAKDKKWVQFHWRNAIEQFRQVFHKAWKTKDGSFFHALGHVIEKGNQDYELWSKREHFIAGQCSWAEDHRVPLPTAGQLLRGWKLHCGIVPTGDDLKALWGSLFPKIPLPTSRELVVKRLGPFIGKPDEQAADVQIVQIQRDARNVGFNLTKNDRPGLPCGFQSSP